MAILRETVSWQKPRSRRYATVLTKEEQANARAALRYLREKVGSWRVLASTMGIKQESLEQAAKRDTRFFTADMAIRTARAAGVYVETILGGAWPMRPSTCPTCGQKVG